MKMFFKVEVFRTSYFPYNQAFSNGTVVIIDIYALDCLEITKNLGIHWITSEEPKLIIALQSGLFRDLP